MRSIGLWRWYINLTVTVLDIIHRHVFYLKHTMDDVHTSRETVTSPLRVQQVNAIYRCVAMVY
jgi:hypothetical protein